MGVLKGILTFIFVVDALAMIGLILMQMSKHGSLGGAFGGGGTNTVFGRDETRDPKRTATSWLALGFIGLALLLSMLPDF